jgi:hypothetical protein
MVIGVILLPMGAYMYIGQHGQSALIHCVEFVEEYEHGLPIGQMSTLWFRVDTGPQLRGVYRSSR